MLQKEPEYILNDDQSIYHLALKSDEIRNTIITVGDPHRVGRISRHFDELMLVREKREFVTHIGRIGSKELMVISTGIGAGNIEIVFNELDALANYDFEQKRKKASHRTLQFIRIGTSGAIQKDIPIDSFILSNLAIGTDGIMHNYYRDHQPIITALESQLPIYQNKLYAAGASDALLDQFASLGENGMCWTASGFYAPQGRRLYKNHLTDELIETLTSFNHKDDRFTNIEMETAAIYGFAHYFGHEALSLNAILANRLTDEFSSQPLAVVDQLIEKCLDILT